jgi:hypothetical protein
LLEASDVAPHRRDSEEADECRCRVRQLLEAGIHLAALVSSRTKPIDPHRETFVDIRGL